MAVNIYGGGARTNFHGLQFEQETSLEVALQNAGFIVMGSNILRNGQRIGIVGAKYNFIRNILIPLGIDIGVLSKKLLPDEAFINLNNNTVYILEKKFQHSSGSVDEKLQTCDFKKKQYQKLFYPKGINVEYCYICNDWFLQSSYRDVHEYIHSVGCRIFFDEVPLEFMGLI